jgi:uncharacterized protein YecT (DUF1311 family)
LIVRAALNRVASVLTVNLTPQLVHSAMSHFQFGLLWLGLAMIGCHTAAGASFDCGKTSTAVERTVCANADLSKLDDALARIFAVDRAVHLPDVDMAALVRTQKQWIVERDRCSATAPEAIMVDCLKSSYESRIKAISKLKLTTPYGVLRYHLVDAGEFEPVGLIAELFSETFNRDGPLKRDIKCNNTTAESFCPGLATPTASNTVMIDHGSGGWATGFAALYRSLLTDGAVGIGHFTNPVVALDFEFVDDRSEPEGIVADDITVSLTGMAPLASRLPHLKGLPEASGCFGCQ